MNRPMHHLVITTTLLSLTAAIPSAAPAAEPTSTTSPAAEVEPTTQVLDSLRQVIAALKDGRPAQIDRSVYVAPGVDGQLTRIFILQDAALSRLDRAWSKRFAGTFPIQEGGHLFQNAGGGLECLLESGMGELKDDDVIIEGDTAQIILDLRRNDPNGDAQYLFGPWIDAAIHMIRLNGQWKLDLSRTMTVTMDASFAPDRTPATPDEQSLRHLHFREQTIALADTMIRRLEAGDFAGPVSARTFIMQEAERLLAADGITSVHCDPSPAK